MRPYNSLVHPRSWRAFMEYGNGIVGDMCIHMFDMARWMMDLGWPTRVASTGGILVDKASKANITDTQTVTFDYPDVKIVWQHRSWGASADPKYPWGATFYGDKGTLKAGVYGYDFIPEEGNGQPVHKDVTYEFEQYPEDKTEKDLERHVAPAIRGHMRNLLPRSTRAEAGRGHRAGLHLDRELHPGQSVAASSAAALTWDPVQQQVAGDAEANQLPAPPLSPALGASRSRECVNQIDSSGRKRVS